MARSGRGAVVEQVADAFGGVGEQFVDAAVAVECLLLDLVGGVEEGAAGGEVADDAGVGAGVAGGGDPAGELVDGETAAGSLDHAVLGQLVGDGVSVSIGSWHWRRASIAV